MAQQRPRLHRHRPPVIGPRYTLRQIVWVVIGFLVLVGVLVISLSMISTTSSSSTRSRIRQQNNNINDDNDARSTAYYTSPSQIPLSIVESLDAILVLGGGVPESIDKPPIYVQRRCDDAVAVASRRHDSNNNGSKKKTSKTKNYDGDGWIPIMCLSAGTAHVPQLIGYDGYPIWESTACAAYITQQYIDFPPSQLFVETTSYDTIGNAYFTRVSHTDINGWKNLLIVTDEFHMDRTKLIFDWVFGAVTTGRINNNNNDGSYTRNSNNNRKNKNRSTDPNSSSSSYNLWYLSTPNVGLTDEAITARTQREQQSARTLQTKIIPHHQSLQEIYEFLTHDHSLYTAKSLIDRGHGGSGGGDGTRGQVDSNVKLSYGGGGGGHRRHLQ